MKNFITISVGCVLIGMVVGFNMSIYKNLHRRDKFKPIEEAIKDISEDTKKGYAKIGNLEVDGGIKTLQINGTVKDAMMSNVIINGVQIDKCDLTKVPNKSTAEQLIKYCTQK